MSGTPRGSRRRRDHRLGQGEEAPCIASQAILPADMGGPLPITDVASFVASLQFLGHSS